MRNHAERPWQPMQAPNCITLTPCHELVSLGGGKCRRDIAEWISEVEHEHEMLQARSTWTEGDKWR